MDLKRVKILVILVELFSFIALILSCSSITMVKYIMLSRVAGYVVGYFLHWLRRYYKTSPKGIEVSLRYELISNEYITQPSLEQESINTSTLKNEC